MYKIYKSDKFKQQLERHYAFRVGKHVYIKKFELFGFTLIKRLR